MTLPISVSAEAVVQAWLATIPGIASSMVGSTLPEDNSTWAASGFITTYIVGGKAGMYMPLRSPKVMLCAYATTPGSSIPPWNLAKDLAEAVVAATYNQSLFGNTLTIPYASQDAVVMTAFPLSEPRRGFGDLGDYAMYTVDIQFNWKTR